MTDKISSEELAAYVNGELDETRSAAVKQALEQDPELRRAEAELRGAAPAEEEKMTGERSESSVLFSASQLQALAAGAAAASDSKQEVEDESSSLLDIRSMVGGGVGGGDAGGVDDLISVSAGYAQPLGAPVLGRQEKEGLSTGAKVGIIIGGVAVVACAVVIIVLLLQPAPAPQVDSAATDAQIAQLMEEIAKLKAGGGANTAEMAALEQKLQEEQAAKAAAEAGGADKAADDKTKRGDGKGDGKAGGGKVGGGKVGSGKAGGGKAGADAPSGGGDKAGADAPASGGKTDEAKPPPKKHDELDDLLGGSTKGPPKKKTDPPAGGGGGGGVPDKLTRAQVQKGMSAVAGSVKACGKGEGGKVTVSVKIEPNGRVTSAQAVGAHAGTPVGTCAARAVRRAKFPQTKSSLSVKYPFAL